MSVHEPPETQYPATLTALHSEQQFLIFIATTLEGAAQRTGDPVATTAATYVRTAITYVEHAAEALATAVRS